MRNAQFKSETLRGGAARLTLAALASVAVYIVGMVFILSTFYGMQGGNSMNEWSDGTQRNFWMTFWSFPVAILLGSFVIAREFKTPVLATVLVTGFGISIVWLMYWARQYWLFTTVFMALPFVSLVGIVLLGRRLEAPPFATATIAFSVSGILFVWSVLFLQ